jgi:succinoglycan biosynthesis protein ExoM
VCRTGSWPPLWGDAVPLASSLLRIVTEPPAAGNSDAVTSIVVAVLTFKRPGELAEFLEVFARIERPAHCRLMLLVVDNDAKASARELVAAWQERIPGLRYVVEPKVGIPVARNRAVREALACSADALCFIDDDETPDARWLVHLVAAWRHSKAHLVGGPVSVAAAPFHASPWQRLINASLASRARRKNAMTARAAATGGRFTIVTNNWLCDLHWLTSNALRFDERLLLTGGSDTAFCRAAVAAGCRKAWAADAIVQETIGTDRLTLRYQLWRGMSQSMTHFRMKELPLTPRLVAATAAIAAARALVGLLLLVLPVYGIGSMTIAVRSLGWAAGRIQAIRGRESRLYAFAAEQATDGEPAEEAVLKLHDGDSGDPRHSLRPVWRRAA